MFCNPPFIPMFMNNRKEIPGFFIRKKEEKEHELAVIQKKMRKISQGRVVVFLLTVLAIYLTSTTTLSLVASVSLLGTAVFVTLVAFHLRLEKKKQIAETLLEINKLEIRLYHRDTSGQPDGLEYTEAHHPYAADLDITGQRSLYQLLNRSATQRGSKRLAHTLLNPSMDNRQIQQRQEAVKELKDKPDWRQAFQATGNLAEKNNTLSLQETPFGFSFDRFFYRILLFLHPVVGFTILYFVSFQGMNILFFLLFLLSPLTLIGSKLKIINAFYSRLSKKDKFLSTMASLLEKIEQEAFVSELLQKARQELTADVHSASAAMKRLKKIAAAFDYRLNMLVGILLNIFFLWDILQCIRLERWENAFAKKTEQWLDTVALVDELCSLAGFAFQHHESVFATIHDTAFHLEGKNLKHPFIEQKKCIGNPVHFTAWKQFQIITGANMAGKSTYLRTVGINMVLAMAGAPVLAQQFSLSPVQIFTGIKTSDSLQDGESYFFSELKRLKEIITRLEAGEKIFIILDEILRGTNSADKQTGSKALIKKLIRLGASGIIATHDLSLGELAQYFPENSINKRFEVEIENNRLHFDYLLKEGVSQNLNATFLMKKMGITE